MSAWTGTELEPDEGALLAEAAPPALPARNSVWISEVAMAHCSLVPVTSTSRRPPGDAWSCSLTRALEAWGVGGGERGPRWVGQGGGGRRGLGGEGGGRALWAGEQGAGWGRE